MLRDLFYVADGKEQPLRRTDTVRLISPAREYTVAHVAARLARSSRLAIDAGPAEGCLVVRGDAAKLAETERYPDIRSARSAFSDSAGHEMLLTDDILVQFDETMDETDRSRMADRHGCSAARKLTYGTWRLRVDDPHPDAPLIAANRLSEERGVTYAEPNMLAAAKYHWPPGDPLFANQWHLDNTGQRGGTPGADVGALEAWRITRGDPRIRIVVHDTGIDIRHPDLTANLEPGWDFDHGDDDASNADGPHGTACAGIVAAASNGNGCVGVAPDCRLVPLRAAGRHTFETWAGTIRWAAANGEVISCSWSIGRSSALTDAIRAAVTNGRDGMGIPVFFAAGNDALLSNGIAYPAALPFVMAVGASTNLDQRAQYSQFGQGLDIVAPSGGGTLSIETTDVSGPAGYNRRVDGDYCEAGGPSGFSGTSAATPLAAGVAALMLSANPGLRAEDVFRLLRDTADKIDPAVADYDSTGWSPVYGFGRVNAARAVAAAREVSYSD